MSKVKASDYKRIGVVSFQELLSYSETVPKDKYKDLIDIFVDYTYKKFELHLYILRNEMKDAIFLKKDEMSMHYEVFLKNKYIESDESTIADVKSLIGLD